MPKPSKFTHQLSVRCVTYHPIFNDQDHALHICGLPRGHEGQHECQIEYCKIVFGEPKSQLYGKKEKKTLRPVTPVRTESLMPLS